MNTRHPFRFTALAAAIAATATIATLASAQDTRLYDTHVLPNSLMIEPVGDLAMGTKVDLILRGPNGFYQRQSFDAGELVEFDPSTVTSEAMPNGTYQYEIRIMDIQGLESSRETGEIHSIEPGLQNLSGAFSIKNGQIVSPDVQEAPADKSSQRVTSKGATTDAELRQGTQAQVIADDQIVQGSLCVGFDCATSESFGFDTIRLKENNLRIKFQDTSTTGSFPSNDWQLTANDSANGGANKFSIDDVTGGRTPFTVEAGAPSNSLYVENSGEVGFGTSNPVVEGHFVDGDTPTVRLEQDGSSGFTPQTWDVAGNETNFFVRDTTNGSRLPFKIRPGASTNSLVLHNGNVGVGVLSPSNTLHIQGTDGTTSVRIEETSTSLADRQMLTLENKGGSRIDFVNTDSGNDWRFATETLSDSFIITKRGTGKVELRVDNAGNLTIPGTLSQGSDIRTKFDITPAHATEILSKVMELPIAFWRYKSDEDARHIGPMAQDFARLFGVGKDETTISTLDTSGVALASVQAVTQKLQEKTAQLESLHSENQELAKENETLKARMDRLESMVQILSDKL